jgi:hypothetical protein
MIRLKKYLFSFFSFLLFLFQLVLWHGLWHGHCMTNCATPFFFNYYYYCAGSFIAPNKAAQPHPLELYIKKIEGFLDGGQNDRRERQHLIE